MEIGKLKHLSADGLNAETHIHDDSGLNCGLKNSYGVLYSF